MLRNDDGSVMILIFAGRFSSVSYKCWMSWVLSFDDTKVWRILKVLYCAHLPSLLFTLQSSLLLATTAGAVCFSVFLFGSLRFDSSLSLFKSCSLSLSLQVDLFRRLLSFLPSASFVYLFLPSRIFSDRIVCIVLIAQQLCFQATPPRQVISSFVVFLKMVQIW